MKMRTSLLVLCWIVVTACSDELPREVSVETPVEAPLAKLEVWGHEAYIDAAKGVRLEDLVDISPLRSAGLSPGETLDEVRAILGEPNYRSTSRQGRDLVFGYRTDKGRIEIIRQEVESEDYEVVHWLTTYVPLPNARPLHPALEEAIRDLRDLRSAVVMAGEHGADRAGITWRDQRIQRIRWYRVGD